MVVAVFGLSLKRGQHPHVFSAAAKALHSTDAQRTSIAHGWA